MDKIPVIKQKDILLVPFPFSDQSGRKVRPVVVISNSLFNDYSDDFLVAGITSNITRGKYSLLISNSDLEEGKLFSKCCIKTENILKIDGQLIVKKIGRLKKQKFEDLIETINRIIASENTN